MFGNEIEFLQGKLKNGVDGAFFGVDVRRTLKSRIKRTID